MAPARSRTTHDSTKPDSNHKGGPSNGTTKKSRYNSDVAGTAGISRMRAATRTTAEAEALKTKDMTSATSNGTTGKDGAQTSSSGLQWSTEGLETLQSYRNAYRLEIPSAFKSPITAAILAAPGIGRFSPTMARKKEKRKIGKEQLATAVRKHFNSVAVNETEVITDFVYATKNQDRSFKMRFAPAHKPKHG